jgi:hypothetical protein
MLPSSFLMTRVGHLDPDVVTLFVLQALGEGKKRPLLAVSVLQQLDDPPEYPRDAPG